MYKHRITVFTPTYNRAYIIGKLYNSLCEQSFYNFEWLIVDDGSTDGTEQLIKKWKKEAFFEINYYKVDNGGKHRAVNYGLNKANGELFFTVDSDDELTKDALQKIDFWFSSISGVKDICGIAANKGTAFNLTPNNYFDYDYLDASWLETYTYRENGELVLSGERAIIFYTDFHKKYPYPEFPSEKFVTEAVVYNRMANDGYKMRFYNDIIWIYEYLDDGLTKAGNTLFLNNPKGYGLWLKEKSIFTKESFIQRLKLYYTFTCELKDKYDTIIISECIGAPKILIDLLLIVHKTISMLKRK